MPTDNTQEKGGVSNMTTTQEPLTQGEKDQIVVADNDGYIAAGCAQLASEESLSGSQANSNQ